MRRPHHDAHVCRGGFGAGWGQVVAESGLASYDEVAKLSTGTGAEGCSPRGLLAALLRGVPLLPACLPACCAAALLFGSARLAACGAVLWGGADS